MIECSSCGAKLASLEAFYDHVRWAVDCPPVKSGVPRQPIEPKKASAKKS